MAALGSFSLCILFLIVCHVSSVASSTDRMQQKYDEVLDEVTDLRKTMMQMREDMKVMKKISKALNNLCAELQLPDSSTDPAAQEHEPINTVANGTKGVHEELEKEEEDNRPQNEEDHLTSGPFQIKSLEVNNGTFRIEYDGNVTDEVVHTEYENPTLNMSSMKPEKLFSTKKGVITGSVSTSSNYFSILAGDFAVSISFMPFNQTSSEIDLEPLEMKSDVRTNIIFESRQKIEFKVTVKTNKNDPNHLDLGMYTPFKDGIVNLVTSGSPGIVNITTKEEFPEYSEIYITVNADREDHEGLLYLTLSKIKLDFMGFEDMFYSVHQLVEVKRSDHQEPFENGYIGFVKSEYVDTNFDLSCQSGKMCRLGATLVGNTPDDITLWRMFHGKKTQMKVPEHRAGFGTYVLIVAFYLQTMSSDDQGRYFYRGISRKGTVVEQEFVLSIFT